MIWGNEFQTVGPATENARVPKVLRRTCGTDRMHLLSDFELTVYTTTTTTTTTTAAAAAAHKTTTTTPRLAIFISFCYNFIGVPVCQKVPK